MTLAESGTVHVAGPHGAGMQLPTLVMVAIVAVSAAPRVRVTRSDPVLVRAVVSGDTIDVAGVGRVRLLGIAAPQRGRGSVTVPLAREARDRLAALVLRRWVRLERESALGDRQARRAAYVLTEDGRFVNATLVREGLARVTDREPRSRARELRRAESEARMSRRGIWSGRAGAIRGPRRPARGRGPT